MSLNPFKRTKELDFERTYDAPIERVWQAWTEPDSLRQWWAPKDATVEECEVDLRVGGDLRIVMEAGEGMGKYRGTRWPMAGTFTAVDQGERLAYDARSWTEGEEATSFIEHTNQVTFTRVGDATQVRLTIAITKIGPKAKMAAFGMKFGYKAYLDNLAKLLTDAAG